MNFNVYIVGYKIEKFFLESIKEYEKRLSRYCKIKYYYIKNKEQLLKKLPQKGYKILISTKGTNISSEELASKINNFAIVGTSDIDIIIGSSPDDTPCDELLALSTMEMALGLTATVTTEQIYRAYRILNNQPYHK